MSADEMREAASILRSPEPPVHPAVGVPLADWLDGEAGIYESLHQLQLTVKADGYTVTIPISTQAEAEKVARAVIEAAATA